MRRSVRMLTLCALFLALSVGIALAVMTLPPKAAVDDQVGKTTVLPQSSDGELRQVFVDPSSGRAGGGGNRFTTIQDAINAVMPGGTVSIPAGDYYENLTIDKSLTLSGASTSTVRIYPSTSAPGIDGPPSFSGSQVIVVAANDVTIENLTIDGDNPTISSGVSVNGVDIDARNGIIEADGPWNNLEVRYCDVRNIFLRGIYARSGGSGFNFHHNVVTNVAGGSNSIAIFAFGASGTIAANTVSYANDAISANWSRGIQFLNNVVTHSGSGIHTDNSGGFGGVADLIQSNQVSLGGTNSYGVWVFFPYLNPTVDLNTVSGQDVGLFAWGGSGGTATFSDNTVDGTGKPNAIGIYVTAGPDYWMSWQGDVSGNFSGNSVTNTSYGWYIETDESAPYFNATVSASGMTMSGVGTEVATFGLGAFSVSGVSGASVEVSYPGKVQLGVDMATPGGTVRVVAGSYAEALVLAKPVSVLGAGYATTTLDATGAAAVTAVDIASPGGNVTFDGFKVNIRNAGGTETHGLLVVSNSPASTIAVTNNYFQGTNDPGAWDFGVYVHDTSSSFVFQHNTVTANAGNPILIEKNPGATDVSFNTFDRGIADEANDAYFNMNHDAPPVTTLQKVHGNTIDLGTGAGPYDNAHRSSGVSFAAAYTGTTGGFTNIEVSDNVFVNLKSYRRGIALWNNAASGPDGDFTGVLISGNTITGYPGSDNRYGIRLLGYASGVTIENNAVDSVDYSLLGRPWNGHVAPGATIRKNSFTNIVSYLDWQGTSVLNASQNWWGTNIPATVATKVSGLVDFTPLLDSGVDTNGTAPGFQPDLSSMTVHTLGSQSGVTGRIQEGADLVVGSTVNLASGTYAEMPVISGKTNFTLQGVSHTDRPVLTAGLKVASSPNTTLRDLIVRGNTGNNFVLDARDFYGFTMDAVTVDGESIANRFGVGGGAINGDISITRCEFLNIAGWVVFDTRSGSGGPTSGADLGNCVFSGNTVRNSKGHVNFRGIICDPATSVLIRDNLVEQIGSATNSFGGIIKIFYALSATVTGNTFKDVGTSGYNPAGEAPYGAALMPRGVQALTVSGNHFENCNQAIAFEPRNSDAFGCPDGVLSGGTIGSNEFVGCAYGVYIPATQHPTSNPAGLQVERNSFTAPATEGIHDGFTGGTLGGERNWWGSATGPTNGGNPDGTGVACSNNVDFDPWIGKEGGENVACNPEPVQINVADPAGNDLTTVRYLGGGGGALYGYSIDVKWDASIAGYVSITKPPTGPFASAVLFQVVNVSDPGFVHKRVDVALGGGNPGTLGPADLFIVTLHGLSCSTGTPIDLTLNYMRNSTNQNLGGFYANDGELQVDLGAPTVTATSIIRTNLPNTGYVKNGDTILLTATVQDACNPLTSGSFVANLTQFGGGAAVAPTSYVGTLATWEYAGIVMSPDGTKTATITATDALGNVGTGSASTIADNTPPTASVSGFQAQPGHNKVQMNWTNPSGDPDLDTYGIMIRRADWGDPDYPSFAGAAPSYPGATGGVLAYQQVGMVTGWTNTFAGTGMERDIYAYQAFVFDKAYNYSAESPGARDMATNYWLGDVTPIAGTDVYTYTAIGDGDVDTQDISALAGSYYALQTDAWWNPHCDVGPTLDGSPTGLPAPDGFVDFEDLMMFALNYGTVAPLTVPQPAIVALGSEGRGAVGLTLGPIPNRVRAGEILTVPVLLRGQVSGVQGVSAALGYDASQLRYESSAVSSVIGQTPHFFKSIPSSGRVGLDLATLGAGTGLTGEGPVFLVRFRVLREGQANLTLTAGRVRDASNQDLLTQPDLATNRSAEPAQSLAVPVNYGLGEARPNPFNPKTEIAFDLPQAGYVQLTIYDVSGRVVRSLVGGALEAGTHRVEWDGRDDGGRPLGSGIYFCVMKTDGFHAQKRLTLLK